MEELTLEKLRWLGGQATFKKYGKAHYQRMSQKSQEAKRRKKQAQIAA